MLTNLNKKYGMECFEELAARFADAVDWYTQRMEINKSATELTDWNQQIMEDMLHNLEYITAYTPLEGARASYRLYPYARLIIVDIERGTLFKPEPDKTFFFDSYQINY